MADDGIRIGSDFLSFDTPLDTVLHRPAARLMTHFLAPHPIHPNQVTLASLIPGFGAAACFSRGTPAWLAAGLAAFWTWAVVDHADGELARAKRLTSDFGKKLDDACDTIASGAMMAGLFWGLLLSGQSRHPFHWTALFILVVVLNETGHNLMTAAKRRWREELVRREVVPVETVKMQKTMDYFSGRAPFYLLILLVMGASFFAPIGSRWMIEIMTGGTFLFGVYGFGNWMHLKAQLASERSNR